MARVVHMKGAPEFFKELGRSLASLPTAAVDFILHPVRSAHKVGKGLSKTWQRMGDLFRSRPRSHYEDSASGVAFHGDEKRKLAADLKLDVYSTNPQVQAFLDRIANWRAAGNLGIDLASFALPVVGFLAVTTAKWRADVERLLRDKSPAELDRHNAGALMDLGIPRSTWSAFISHHWLSPRHKTVITAALNEMKGTGNLGAMLEVAATAPSEVGALFQEQQAVLLSHYHTNVEKVASLYRVQHVVVGYTTSGSRAVFLPADEVYWTVEFEAFANALRGRPIGDAAAKPLRLFVVGRVTPRARAELARRGIEVVAPYRPDV